MTESKLCNGTLSDSDKSTCEQEFQSTSAPWEGFFETVVDLSEQNGFRVSESQSFLLAGMPCLAESLNNNNFIGKLRNWLRMLVCVVSSSKASIIFFSIIYPELSHFTSLEAIHSCSCVLCCLIRFEENSARVETSGNELFCAINSHDILL